MGFATIRDEVKTLLEAITDIGVVLDRVPHSADWEKFRSTFLSGNRVNVWTISRISHVQTIRAVQGQTSTLPFFFDTHMTEITGRLGLKDSKETEKEFQDLVDSVLDKLRVNNLLNGKVITPILPFVEGIAHESYSGVLVHVAIIRFEAVEPVGG